MVKGYYQCIIESMITDKIYTFEEISELISTKITYNKRYSLNMFKKTPYISQGLKKGIEKNEIIQIRNPQEKAKYVRHKYMKIV